MKTCCKIILSLVTPLMLSASVASAQLAKWTFETSVPTTAGPHAAEIGSGSALGFHAGTTTYSNPAGNGSAESFSSNGWVPNDYYQFSLSTLGYSGIGLNWDQASSSTGPRDFSLSYSTDGVNFTSVLSYGVLISATPNAWNSTTYLSMFNFDIDLSSFTALDNAPMAYFRLINTTTTSAGGGTVASTGSDRVDNFTVRAVPEPTAFALAGLASVILASYRRRN